MYKLAVSIDIAKLRQRDLQTIIFCLFNYLGNLIFFIASELVLSYTKPSQILKTV